MVSKLYSSSLISEALPVIKESVGEITQKVKKPRAKKAKVDVEPMVETEAPRPPAIAEAPAKKPRSEKQIAAAAKMVEARRLKKEQQQAEIDAVVAEKEQKEAELAEKLAARAAKKEANKLKRKTAKETPGEIAEETPNGDSVVADSPSGKTPAKKRKVVDANGLPSWMPHIISEIRGALDGTKSKKQIHAESRNEAQEKWEDPQVRSRVNDVVNKAGHKMYASMFPGRQLK